MKITFILFLIFSFGQSVAQYKSLPAEVITSIQHRINERLNPSIVIGIIDISGPHFFSYGLTKKGGRKVNEHSIYEIGSISKVFTATLLADMAVKGIVSISDPIEKFLPTHLLLPTYDQQSITLGNLSDHTSSFPRLPDNMVSADPANPYADYTVEHMYAFLDSLLLKHPIGSRYEYSNLAVGLLGHILALQSGKTYEDLLLTTIVRPLNMQETRISLDKKMKKNLARGHYEGSQVPNWDLPTLAGAGAIRSSTSDLLKFLAAHMQLVDSPLKEAALLTQQQRHDKAGNNRVGLGWHIAEGQDGDIYWHNGGTGGYTTFAGFVRETQTGVVVMTNSNESVDDIGYHLLDRNSPLRKVIPNVSLKLKEIIDTEGYAGLIEKYQQIRKDFPTKYEYAESGINSLGYYYLHRKQFKEAQAVFQLNMKEFPGSANVYDSYAEALMEDGQNELATLYYNKSLELNPGNTNAVEMLAKMGVIAKLPDVIIEKNVLEKYTGTYELMQGFEISITLHDHQLMAQATGQSAYEIYPRNDVEFYYKVVDAQIKFNVNHAGKVESLTLYQGGRVTEGRKQ